jgi:hypothetical protein
MNFVGLGNERTVRTSDPFPSLTSQTFAKNHLKLPNRSSTIIHKTLTLQAKLLDKETRSRGGIGPVSQMSRSDYQRVITNKVTNCAEDLGLTCRVIRDLAIILRVAREPKQNDARDLVLD